MLRYWVTSPLPFSLSDISFATVIENPELPHTNQHRVFIIDDHTLYEQMDLEKEFYVRTYYTIRVDELPRHLLDVDHQRDYVVNVCAHVSNV